MKKLSFLLIVTLSFMLTSCATLDVLSAVKTVSEVKNFVTETERATKKAEKTQVSSREKIELASKTFMAAAEDITPENQYIIGRAVASSILGTYSLYENAEATAYVNKICAVLTMNSSMPYLYKGYSVAILDTEDFNAMATPGGHIFITRGFLQSAGSEDEIAAVLAHEISHIQLGHSIQSIKSSRAMSAVISTVESYQNSDSKEKSERLKALENLRDDVVNKLVQTGFSKAQEFAADENALTVMSDAGYDSRAMLLMLQTLKDKTSSTGWSKTHPKPETRIKTVMASVNLLPKADIHTEARVKRFNAAKVNF